MPQVLLQTMELMKSGRARTATENLLEQDQVEDSLRSEMMDSEQGHQGGRSPMRSAPNDYRPNRLVKGSTRTSRVIRRAGMFNSTAHRDQVLAHKQREDTRDVWRSVTTQKWAALRIQRFWRSWYEYCIEHQDWMTTTWICATMIQAAWRSYHVRRVKLDVIATNIQRHVRRYLVQ